MVFIQDYKRVNQQLNEFPTFAFRTADYVKLNNYFLDINPYKLDNIDAKVSSSTRYKSGIERKS